MAKEQWHNWGRTVVILAGIVFAGGGYAMKIQGNTSDIADNRAKIEKTVDDVHAIEVRQERDAGVKEAIFSALNRLETEQRTMRVAQKRSSDSIIKIESKVNHLTRDE
jgi:outer membrane murein-binding lipoprotein Lpp